MSGNQPKKINPAAGQTTEGKQPEIIKSEKYPWWIFPLVLVLIGTCIFQYARSYNDSRDLAVMQTEYLKLTQEQAALQNYISDVSATVNEVSLKLSDSRRRQVNIQGMISAPEAKQPENSQRSRMLNDLSAIRAQLDSDRHDLDALEKRMQGSKVKVTNLEKMVAQLKAEIDRDQVTINNLGAMLRNKEYALDQTRDSLIVSQSDLANAKQELEDRNKTLAKTRNAAFYVVGKPDELKKKHILQRYGWMWWKHDELTGRFDIGDFNRIDITEQDQFVLNRKSNDVKVIPSRDRNSYRIEDKGKNQSVLKVTDQEEFWKVPYLVMELDLLRSEPTSRKKAGSARERPFLFGGPVVPGFSEKTQEQKVFKYFTDRKILQIFRIFCNLI